MQKLFRTLFGHYTSDTMNSGSDVQELAGGGTGFSGLMHGLQLGGNEVLRVVMIIAVFAAVIMLTVSFIMYFFSSRGKERDDAKQRVTRTLISIALIFLASSLVITIFLAFYGSYSRY